MKANQFLKEHGFQYTRNLVRDLVRAYPHHTHVTDDGRMFINENTCVPHIKVQLNELVKMDDLKRLVESHELVESHGGLYQARKAAHKNCFEYPVRLLQAIADVESCQ